LKAKGKKQKAKSKMQNAKGKGQKVVLVVPWGDLFIF